MDYLNKFATAVEYDAATLSYPNISYITATNELKWQKSAPPVYSAMPLTFRALSGDTTFKNTNLSCQYSIDNGTTWVNLAADTDSPTVHAGDTIQFRSATEITPDPSSFNQMHGSAPYEAFGNPLSMVYGAGFTGVTDISDKSYIFYGMFMGEGDLQSVDNLALTATGLSTYCYAAMFAYCTSLTSAPVLPATTLAEACYFQMFADCTSLSSITCLATDITASNCTGGWLYDVAQTGTFTKDASMTWPSGDSGVPNGWTVVNA